MMTQSEWREYAEMHGYVRYVHRFGCGRAFYSDSGPECPYCGPDEKEEPDQDEEPA